MVPAGRCPVAISMMWLPRIMSQRVLITAGAAGIGREFARAFAANGAKVFVCDIDEKALAAIADPVVLNGRTLAITGSLGVSLYPADGESAAELVRNADKAM